MRNFIALLGLIALLVGCAKEPPPAALANGRAATAAVEKSETLGKPAAARVIVAAKPLTAPSSPSVRSRKSYGPVFVKGYYRKDGTFVQSHYRRRPSR
jgi:hypothetical protein